MVATRSGLTADRNRRHFAVEFEGLSRDAPAPRVDVGASRGTISNVVARWSPAAPRYRVSFDLDPGRETLVELRMLLLHDSTPASETWLYRWTPA